MSNDVAIYGQGNVTLLDARMDAKRFPRLKTYPREEAVGYMGKIVAKAFMYRGQAADEMNVHFISSSLVDELLADTPKAGLGNLSFLEINSVIKQAVLGTEMYGISVASLYKVLLDYAKNEGHRLDQEARDRTHRESIKALKESAIAPMLQSYAGAMVRKK